MAGSGGGIGRSGRSSSDWTRPSCLASQLNEKHLGWYGQLASTQRACQSRSLLALSPTNSGSPVRKLQIESAPFQAELDVSDQDRTYLSIDVEASSELRRLLGGCVTTRRRFEKPVPVLARLSPSTERSSTSVSSSSRSASSNIRLAPSSE